MTTQFLVVVLSAFIGTCFSKGQIAVVEITSGTKDVRGTVVFEALEDGKVHVKGTFYGLEPGTHGVHIHDTGDVSQNCAKVGPHYDPHDEPHGVHVGDIANIVADATGKAVIDEIKTNIHLSGPHSIVGRSLGVDDEEDRYDHNDYETIACGIVKLKQKVESSQS